MPRPPRQHFVGHPWRRRSPRYHDDVANNRTTALTDARGNVTRYCYDALKRRTGISYMGRAGESLACESRGVRPGRGEQVKLMKSSNGTILTGHVSELMDLRILLDGQIPKLLQRAFLHR